MNVKREDKAARKAPVRKSRVAAPVKAKTPPPEGPEAKAAHKAPVRKRRPAAPTQ